MIEQGDAFCVKSDRSVTGTVTQVEQASVDRRERIVYGILDRPLGGPGGPIGFYAPEGSLELIQKGS